MAFPAGASPIYGDDWSLSTFSLNALDGPELRDVFAGSATGTLASVAASDRPDVLVAAGGFKYSTSASLNPLERGDGFAAAGTESSRATLSPTERPDLFAAPVVTRASIATNESGDTFRGGFERVAYHVYANTGAGDPINYGSPIETTSELAYTVSPLSYPGSWEFGVRAFYVISGLEEKNVDCAVSIVLNAVGQDVTNTPTPPFGLRAVPLAAGAVRVEWSYVRATGPSAPQGFHVYLGSGAAPSYATPAATINYNTGSFGQFVANLSGLTGAITYTVGVRAFNATAEEANTNTVTVTADTTGPLAVDHLVGNATS